ncbi:sigma-54 dependent transcriptional regulator [Desulfobotulus sp.]|jgi:DNA-binding NtrC family response regulator|uniref:sigma-54-dependent transcriptional regulator n=1 Tax=Desulfobotulus sp. TaxID=1940337 RepID=UPI002A370B50|nr:sigma-54 dependent transcriptional regulator [Desulfobotulus sp.]MDY0161673.1 sigma-54 dependent transcriptional regulator [Desulfobotulus sp.]
MNSADTLLLVDDESDLLTGLARTILAEIPCEVHTASSAEAALSILKQEPIDLVVTDIRMPGMDGLSLLRKIRKNDPLVSVIFMTGYGTIETAVSAIREGAYDFIPKPFKNETLLHTIRKGLERNRLVRENQRLARMVCPTVPGLVGQSAPMRLVSEKIRMLARTDVTVLISGETGTGKELAARALHETSPRRGGPMITVNCPAIPESMLESELFGYTKGAFTGAVKDRQGYFAAAEGGTLFLDEIGDLPLGLQAKLLRVLQEKEIHPLGSDQARRVDVRILAATHQNLEKKAEAGTFRADLFYRLNVASLRMPSLREIREDLPLLVDHFLEKIACHLRMEKKLASPALLREFMEAPWPGNARELENTLMGLCALTEKKELGPRSPECPPPPCPEPAIEEVQIPDLSFPYQEAKERVIARFTQKYLDHLLRSTAGNISQAARVSGIQRQSLQKILRRHHMDAELYR